MYFTIFLVWAIIGFFLLLFSVFRKGLVSGWLGGLCFFVLATMIWSQGFYFTNPEAITTGSDNLPKTWDVNYSITSFQEPSVAWLGWLFIGLAISVWISTIYYWIMQEWKWM